MKKILLLVFGFCSLLGYSQKEGENEVKKEGEKELKEVKNEFKGGKNEIKANLPLFVAGLPEVSYERLFEDSSAAGIAASVTLENWEVIQTRYMITPYYRLYFGKEKASGFFIEANGSLVSQKSDGYYYNYDYNTGGSTDTHLPLKTITNFGFGAAAGGKWLNKKGYLGEIFAGVGRLYGISDDDYYNYDFNRVYPRVGISIGKRF